MRASNIACLALVSVAAAIHKQVLFLVDTSVNGAMNTDFADSIKKSIAELKAGPFPDMEVALSSFVDKPNVMVGVGQYGGYPGPYREDYCYKSHSVFNTDISDVINGLGDLPQGSGMDLWEGHFEALIRGAVGDLLWKDSTHNMIVLITDTFGHSAALDTLAEKVVPFNIPVRCENGKTVGGFGAQEPSAGNFRNWALAHGDNDFAEYKEMANLLYQQACVAPLTGADYARLVALREMHSPTRVPDVKPFDIKTLMSDPSAHCRYHEYPAYEDVVTALKSRNIGLVVVAVEGLAYTRLDQSQVWDWALSAEIALKAVRNRLVKVNSDSVADLSAMLEEAMIAMMA